MEASSICNDTIFPQRTTMNALKLGCLENKLRDLFSQRVGPLNQKKSRQEIEASCCAIQHTIYLFLVWHTAHIQLHYSLKSKIQSRALMSLQTQVDSEPAVILVNSLEYVALRPKSTKMGESAAQFSGCRQYFFLNFVYFYWKVHD